MRQQAMWAASQYPQPRSLEIATKSISFTYRGIFPVTSTLRTRSHEPCTTVGEWPCTLMKFGAAGKAMRLWKSEYTA